MMRLSRLAPIAASWKCSILKEGHVRKVFLLMLSEKKENTNETGPPSTHPDAVLVAVCFDPTNLPPGVVCRSTDHLQCHVLRGRDQLPDYLYLPMLGRIGRCQRRYGWQLRLLRQGERRWQFQQHDSNALRQPERRRPAALDGQQLDRDVLR